ncbi:N-acetylaspartate synthetase-like isoform 1-T2 [Synchiropus picturatus]
MEHSKSIGSLLVRRYDPRDWQQMLSIYTDGVMEMVVDTAFRGLKYHPESLLLYFLFTVVLCARYYYSRMVICSLLERVVSTDLKDIDKYMNSPDHCLWVAELNGQVVGMVAAHGNQTTRTVTLLRMSVDKRFRKCGIGFTLGQTFLQYAVAQEYYTATLGTTAYSPAAHHLYKRLGFHLVGTTNGYNTAGTTPSVLQRIFYRVRHHHYKLDLQSLD